MNDLIFNVCTQNNQADLENATEVLSGYLERDISQDSLQDIKQKVQDKYRQVYTFTFMHLADAFIQSDCIQVIHFFLSVHVFPGNRTPNLCAANAML